MMRWTIAAVVMMSAACSSHPQEPAGPTRASHQQQVAFSPGGDSDYSLWRGNFGNPDIIDFDVQNGFIWEGPMQQGVLLLNVHRGGIFDAADETLLCRFDDSALIDATTGVVIFTTDGRVVYEGGTRMRRFWFKKTHIYEGGLRDDHILATASADLSHASASRRLLLAALYSAQCGAPELEPIAP